MIYLLIYLVGYVVSYFLSRETIRHDGEVWTVADRSWCLRVSVFSWFCAFVALTIIFDNSPKNETPAKW